MSRSSFSAVIATLGIDLGKNSFHLVGQDQRGAIVLRIKLSRPQLTQLLANIPPCLIGMEACAGAHHIGRQLQALGHDVRLIPAQYVKPFLKGHKNDYRDAEAIAEAVQRPTMSFVAIKTPDQMDLLALHRVRSRLVSQRTGVTNQIRGFLLERGIIVRQGLAPLRQALSGILGSSSDALSLRIVRLIADLAEDWRQLDERIADVSAEIEALAAQDEHCQRLMSVPGVGPIISSAVVAAIGTGAGFKQGRDFGSVVRSGRRPANDRSCLSCPGYCFHARSSEVEVRCGECRQAHNTNLEICDFVAINIARQHTIGKVQLPCLAREGSGRNERERLISGDHCTGVNRAQVNVINTL
jgi:transposase